jgi:hypothetical protein
MASILEGWVNGEITLSRKVDNFERDFANGYLVGELLHKLGHLHGEALDLNDGTTLQVIIHYLLCIMAWIAKHNAYCSPLLCPNPPSLSS